MLGELVDRNLRGLDQLADTLVTGAALFHFAQTMAQGFDQSSAPVRIGEQVVFEVGIALHHPDVAQHFVEHAGRAAGHAFVTQGFQDAPHFLAEQPDHNFAIREGRVVVGYFAQTGCHFYGVVRQRHTAKTIF